MRLCVIILHPRQSLSIPLLTHSLTHSLTPSLTHSLPPSLSLPSISLSLSPLSLSLTLPPSMPVTPATALLFDQPFVMVQYPILAARLPPPALSTSKLCAANQGQCSTVYFSAVRYNVE
jgi:hypothetical protein